MKFVKFEFKKIYNTIRFAYFSLLKKSDLNLRVRFEIKKVKFLS